MLGPARLGVLDGKAFAFSLLVFFFEVVWAICWEYVLGMCAGANMAGESVMMWGEKRRE